MSNQTESPKSENTVRMSSLSSRNYRTGLRFASRSERDRALTSIWDDAALCGMPRDYADTLTLIVPAQFATVFKRQGIQYRAIEVSVGRDPNDKRRFNAKRGKSKISVPSGTDKKIDRGKTFRIMFVLPRCNARDESVI
ncbi:MAG: hypothetical protein QOG91_537, partial [Candidatus Parcubacteria bacterium]|nr:hypothetical protein [Candidatus Parcubacteria bacterium]